MNAAFLVLLNYIEKQGTRLFLLFSVFMPSILSSQTSTTYFQQQTNYRISVTLDAEKRMLHAQLHLTYTNNSPDTLSGIWFHLWPNGYKNSQTAFGKQKIKMGDKSFYFSSDSLRGYIDSLDFSSQSKKLSWKYHPEHIDIAYIQLKYPLHPSQSVEIETPFRVKIPDAAFSRLGYSGSAFYITQWYPKPAVYDNSGWNLMPYLDMGEFYANFGSFDVQITLPEKYTVAATGELKTDSELIRLQKIAENSKHAGAGLQKIPGLSDTDTLKTLQFFQDKVHDFAWFADIDMRIFFDSVFLPKSNRYVQTRAFCKPESVNIWEDACKYINEAITFFSKYAGDYPYEHATAFDGKLGAGGAMEYPMITLIGPVSDKQSLELLVLHEIGHIWFMGMLGFNERKHPWLDEGLTSFYEFLYIQEKEKQGSFWYSMYEPLIGKHPFPSKAERTLGYNYQKAYNKDQTVNTASELSHPVNYIAINYQHTAFLWNYLREYLGTEVFDSIMYNFSEKWRFKHPGPGDLQQHFEQYSPKNTAWFFEEFVQTRNTADYKVSRARALKAKENGADSLKILLKNKGRVASPLFLGIENSEGIIETLSIEGFTGKRSLIVPLTEYQKIIIDPEYVMPEVNRSNNYYENRLLFPRIEPLKIKFLAGIDEPGKTTLYMSPLPAWNGNDGFNPGIFLSNYSIIPKKFGFILAPSVSTKSGKIRGMGSVSCRIHPKTGIVRHINIGVYGKHYALRGGTIPLDYAKLMPEITIGFKSADPQLPDKQQLVFRLHGIWREYESFNLRERKYEVKERRSLFPELTWKYREIRGINPYSFSVSALSAGQMVRASAEVRYKITYNEKGKGLTFRAFAGRIFNHSLYDKTEDLSFKLSGNSPTDDALFNNFYLYRSKSNGFLSMQTDSEEGGFKTYTILGKSWHRLEAINIESNLPGKIPFKVYADLGFYKHHFSNSEVEFVSNAGLTWSIVPDIFEIYFPVYISQNIKDTENLNPGNGRLQYSNFLNRIRFSLRFDLANPYSWYGRVEELF